jgi:hypothetical protein
MAVEMLYESVSAHCFLIKKNNEFQNLNYNFLLSYDENLCVDKIIEWANMWQIGFEPFKVRGRIDSWNIDSSKLKCAT